MANEKSAFGRIPIRPLSYDKIYEVSRFVGEFSSIDSLPDSSNCEINDYALINDVVYIYKDESIQWQKAPDNHIMPRAKEIIVDYLNHVIYMADANRNIIKASASTDEVIKTVVTQLENSPDVLKSIKVTLYTDFVENEWVSKECTIEEAIEFCSKAIENNYNNLEDRINREIDSRMGDDTTLAISISNLIGYGSTLPDASTSPYKFFIVTEDTTTEEETEEDLIKPNS